MTDWSFLFKKQPKPKPNLRQKQKERRIAELMDLHVKDYRRHRKARRLTKDEKARFRKLAEFNFRVEERVRQAEQLAEQISQAQLNQDTTIGRITKI